MSGPRKSPLREKAITCLRIAALRHGGRPGDSDAGAELYRRAAALYSDKALDAKFEELTERGYLEYGVSARTGWLTPKGRDALALVDG